MPQPKMKLKVGVIGPAGFGGSYLCVELINRGHEVIGISRNPEKIGAHELYTLRKVDVSVQNIEELAEAFGGLDVLVNEYGPHSAGHEALQYSQEAFCPLKVSKVLIKDSALPGSDTKDRVGCKARQSAILHHGWRLWEPLHAGKRVPVCPREQGLVAGLPPRYSRQRGTHLLHGRTPWTNGCWATSLQECPSCSAKGRRDAANAAGDR